MEWRIVDHGSFQRAAAAVVGTGAAVAGVAWAWPLAGTPWWVGSSVVATTAWFTGRLGAAGRSTSKRAPTSGATTTVSAKRKSIAIASRVIQALPAGILAGLIGWALTGGVAPLVLAEALLEGALAGAGATLAVGALHLRREAARARNDGAHRPPDPTCLVAEGHDDELSARAQAAHARIARTVEEDDRPETRRLRDVSEQVAGRVLELLERGRTLREQVRAVGVDRIRLRAAALAAAAGTAVDGTARDDLSRAARSARDLHDRVRILDLRLARVQARTELEVALLESAALGVTARGASAALDEIQALGPLGEILREAGRDLDCQLEAMDEMVDRSPAPPTGSLRETSPPIPGR